MSDPIVMTEGLVSKPVVMQGRGIVPGIVEAEALVTRDPISGFGGIDVATGTIIEPRHELFGVCFTGKVLVFPGAKGSSGWSGFFQSTRLMGTAPAAMVFDVVTTKAVLGAIVTRVPTVVEASPPPLGAIRTGDRVRVDGDSGVITVLERASAGRHGPGAFIQ
ncbi:aconitase X swivel domain-containing protein [Pseudolysinimonas sp.]|jgi:predicted aconitase with swiveling domain|uniref:aconitase X swivel domain-containing protein n=1 Tax=Pseudolysinimonas sp. TaxID=2680009 RepID=UPI0037840D86